MERVIIFGGAKGHQTFLRLVLEEKYAIRVSSVSDPVSFERELSFESRARFAIVLEHQLMSEQQRLKYEEQGTTFVVRRPGQSLLEFEMICSKVLDDPFRQTPEATAGDYIGIAYYDFQLLSVAPCDVFVRLGQDHYVKVINADEIYTRDIVERFRMRDQQTFYILRQDFGLFREELLSLALNNCQSGRQDSQLAYCGVALNCLHQTLIAMGFDPFFAELAHSLSKQLLDQLKQDAKNHFVLKEFFAAKSYLADHAIATAAVSCAIARNMRISNDFTLNKLVMAALFHDISLSGKPLAFLTVMELRDLEDLSDMERQDLSRHIHESVTILRKIKNVPPNVETIILQHHERPGGKGFPGGLDSLAVAPLSAVFIVAEEFVQRAMRNPTSRPHINGTLEAMSKEFRIGNYASPMAELLKIFV